MTTKKTGGVAARLEVLAATTEADARASVLELVPREAVEELEPMLSDLVAAGALSAVLAISSGILEAALEIEEELGKGAR